VFPGLPNIFKKESRYFFQYLQFKFLEGGGCAKSQILQDGEFSNKVFHVCAILAAQIRSK
jgi:hypothetical protein